LQVNQGIVDEYNARLEAAEDINDWTTLAQPGNQRAHALDRFFEGNVRATTDTDLPSSSGQQETPPNQQVL